MPPKTSRVLVWTAWLATVLLLLALMTAAAVYWRPEVLRPLFVQALTPAGGSASLDGLEISLSPPQLILRGLRRSHPAEESLYLKKMFLVFDLARLWGEGPWLKLVEAEGISLELEPASGDLGRTWDLGGLRYILAVAKAGIRGAALKLRTKQGILSLELARLEIDPVIAKERRLVMQGRAEWSDLGGTRLSWVGFAGSGQLDAAPSLDLLLELKEGGLALPQLNGPLSGFLHVKLTKGHIAIDELALSVAQGRGELSPAKLVLSGRGGLDGREASLEIKRLEMGRQIQMSVRFKGSLDKGHHGRLEAQGRAEIAQAIVENARLSGDLAGSFSSPSLTAMELLVPAGGIGWEGHVLPLGDLHIRGQAARDADGNILVEGLECRAAGLGTLTGNLLLGDWQPKSGLLEASGLKAAGVLAMIQALLGRPAQGWQAEGKLDLAAEMGGRQPGRWQAKFSSSDLGFSSSDGSVLVGQLAGQVEVAGSTSSQPELTARLQLKTGQALWGTFFLDLAKAPLDLQTSGQVAAWHDLRRIKFKGSLGGFAKFSGQGELSFGQGVLRHQGALQLRDLDLTRLFNTFVRDPFSISLPELSSWRVKGTGHLEIDGGGTGAQADFKGRLLIGQASLETGQGPRIGGLDLDLPLAYSLGRSAVPKAPRPKGQEWGSLKLSELRLPGVQMDTLDLPVALTPNRLWVLGAIRTPLAGGQAVIEDLEVDEPLSPDFQASCIARLKDINLAQLAGPSLPLQGSLGGRLGEVSLNRRMLKTKGRLEGSFFGGPMVVRGLAVELPFSPGRELSASLDARQVNMEPLSQALQVGRITGKFNAQMSGLRLAYGQPVAFTLRVKSVAAPGVKQNVSLKAVNSISLLGTGAGLSGMGLGLFASFFQEFPYEEIAFSCDLKNDVFRVRGLIHEDGVEYLVKRPLLMGINVINRNPDNRISFTDMLERLQRVQQDNAPRQDAAEAKEAR